MQLELLTPNKSVFFSVRDYHTATAMAIISLKWAEITASITTINFVTVSGAECRYDVTYDATCTSN